MTLIEVVSGVALLGTLLAMVLMAYGRHVRQIQRAQKRLEAIAVADRFLGQWLAEGAELAVPGSGDVPGSPGWVWRTSERPIDGALGEQAKVVRVEFFQRRAADRSTPLVKVEILVPRRSLQSTALPRGN